MDFKSGKSKQRMVTLLTGSGFHKVDVKRIIDYIESYRSCMDREEFQLGVREVPEKIDGKEIKSWEVITHDFNGEEVVMDSFSFELNALKYCQTLTCNPDLFKLMRETLIKQKKGELEMYRQIHSGEKEGPVIGHVTKKGKPVSFEGGFQGALNHIAKKAEEIKASGGYWKEPLGKRPTPKLVTPTTKQEKVPEPPKNTKKAPSKKGQDKEKHQVQGKSPVEIPSGLYTNSKVGPILKKYDAMDTDGKKKARIELRKIGFKLSDESTWKKFMIPETKEVKKGGKKTKG